MELQMDSIMLLCAAQALIETEAERIERYKRDLAEHDWFYEMCDDGAVYRQGRAERIRLRGEKAEIDRDGAIWNTYAKGLAL